MFTNIIDTLGLNTRGLNTRQIGLCIFLVVWELIRKWIALYRAGQKNDLIWFVFIFILNTCGILPIIYLILNENKTNKEL